MNQWWVNIGQRVKEVFPRNYTRGTWFVLVRIVLIKCSRANSKFQYWTSPISHDTSVPYPSNAAVCNRNVHMCAHFCHKLEHCGIFVWYIVGFIFYSLLLSVIKTHWGDSVVRSTKTLPPTLYYARIVCKVSKFIRRYIWQCPWQNDVNNWWNKNVLHGPMWNPTWCLTLKQDDVMT